MDQLVRLIYISIIVDGKQVVTKHCLTYTTRQSLLIIMCLRFYHQRVLTYSLRFQTYNIHEIINVQISKNVSLCRTLSRPLSTVTVPTSLQREKARVYIPLGGRGGGLTINRLLNLSFPQMTKTVPVNRKEGFSNLFSIEHAVQ